MLCQDSDGDMNVKMALASPERFVLKPQREGGGNNVYGADIRPVLERLQHSRERTAYILMDRCALATVLFMFIQVMIIQNPPSRHPEHHGPPWRRAATCGCHQVKHSRHLGLCMSNEN